MKIENISLVLKCHSAIGNSLDLPTMMQQCLSTFAYETAAVYAMMEVNSEGRLHSTRTVGRYVHSLPSDAVTLLKSGPSHIVRLSDGMHSLTIQLKNGSLYFIFADDSIDIQFFGSMFASLANRIDTAITACLSVERLDMARVSLETANRGLGQSQNLLSAVASATNLLLQEKDYLQAMAQSLEFIGKATEVDRAYLFVNTLGDSMETSTTSQRVEWTNTGVRPEIDNPILQNLPFSVSGDMIMKLNDGSEFCTIIAHLPDSLTKEVLQSQDIKSILVLPVMAFDRFWGFVGFDDCTLERIWTEDERAVLRAFCGSLAKAIERGTVQMNLEQTQQELIELNASLEQKVAERTEALQQALDNLKHAQKEMVRQEKLVTVGNLVAGIAHEINTPLGAINASAGNLRHTLLELFKEKIPSGSLQDLQFACESANEIDLATRLTSREERALTAELKAFLTTEFPHLNQQQRYARLLAECAIHADNSRLLHQLFDSEKPDVKLDLLVWMMRVRRAIMSISSASEKAADVVRALKTYLYAGTNEKTAVQLRPSIDAVLTLYQSKLRQGVTDEVNIPTGIEVLGNSGELGQVWSNIIDNAIQAMSNHGHITIKAETQGPCVFIEISNTGSVITKEVRKRLFEPMFTTKPQGEGTGLGLSIVKQIIDEHHGTIWANSNHECTTFTIELPKYKSR